MDGQFLIQAIVLFRSCVFVNLKLKIMEKSRSESFCGRPRDRDEVEVANSKTFYSE
jgi:hypothetical protein